MSGSEIVGQQAYSDFACRLLADDQGQVLAEYRQVFEAARLAARCKLHEPLQPQEHATNAAITESTDLCVEVLASVWNSMHP